MVRSSDSDGQRGNVILMTLVIVVSLILLGLMLHLLVRNTTTQEALMQSVGDVPSQSRSSAIAGLNQLIFNLNYGTNTTSDCASACNSGTSTTPNAKFPAPVLHNSDYAATYAVRIVAGSPLAVVATGTIAGNGINHSRMVKVYIEQQGALWRVVAGSLKDAL